jgi:hypothetical protein
MKMREQAAIEQVLLEITTCDLFLGISVDEQDADWEGAHVIQYWENGHGMTPTAFIEAI